MGKPIRSIAEEYVLTLDETSRRIRVSGEGLEGRTVCRDLVEALLYSAYVAGREDVFDAREYRIRK